MIDIEITIRLEGIDDSKAGAEAYLDYYLRTASTDNIVSFDIREVS